MMKQIIYNMVCCLAVLSFTACSDREAFQGQEDMPVNNRIVLGISSGRADTRGTVSDAGAEQTVKHLDVFIFDDTETGAGSKEHYERITVSEGAEKVMLNKRQSDFSEKEKYWVYLVANSTLSREDMEKIASYTDLAVKTQETENIHLTGIASTSEVSLPQEFLMDGIAYLGTKDTTEPSTASAVVLNSGDTSQGTELSVVLRRAAVKIVVNIQQGDLVDFSNDDLAGQNAGYYLKSMACATTLIAGTGVNAAPKLRTTPKTSGEYFKFDAGATPKRITITAYTYSHSWIDTESTFENETGLVVNIPMEYTKEGETEGEYLATNYYQIPVSESEKLERNTYYEVTVTVNAPGGEDPLKPVELKNVLYKVADWSDVVEIDINGDDRPKYLTVNEEEMVMYNVADDATTLQFASSSEVSVEIVSVYYIDKFGQKKELELKEKDTYGEKTNTSGWSPSTSWKNECEIKITPDPELSGNIHIYSDLPTNKTIRYIELKVSNKDGSEPKSVTVAQYPLEYISNKQSWYSYRKDFKITDSNSTTYEYKGDRVYGISLATDDISSWDGQYEYEILDNFDRFSALDAFFTSKYAVEDKRTGKSQFYYYYYRYNGNRSEESLTEYNARLYHIVLTASSGEYTIGRPRQIFDDISGLFVTDPGEDNAKLVSPSFMIASSLSGFLVGGGNLTLDSSDNSLRIAREHCANYVEVAEDGTVYDDWRLPTKAELDIILNFQGTEDEDADAIDFLLNGNYYYHAGGRTYNPNYNVKGAEPRCVRDAYDD